MKYIVLENIEYEGTSVHEFDSRVDADKFLSEKAGWSYTDLDDYRLIEYTQEFDVGRAVSEYNKKSAEIRLMALSKLTDEEKAVLGVS